LNPEVVVGVFLQKWLCKKKNSRQIQWWLVLSLNFAVLNLPMLSNPKMVSFLKNIFMVVQ
jgi:hypothetical protein